MKNGRPQLRDFMFCAIYAHTMDVAQAYWKAYNRWDLDPVTDREKLKTLGTYLLARKNIQKRIYKLLKEQYVREGMTTTLNDTHRAILEKMTEKFKGNDSINITREEKDIFIKAMEEVRIILDGGETKRGGMLIPIAEAHYVDRQELEPPLKETKELPPIPSPLTIPIPKDDE